MFVTMESTSVHSSNNETTEIKIEWTELSPDLLHLIAKNLPDIYSFIRFRVVCRKWRCAVSIRDHPPLLLWLLDSRDWHPSLTTRHFYSIQHQKSHTIEILQAPNKCLMGLSYGYMLIYGINDNGNFQLSSFLNRFTGVQIDIDLLFESGDFNHFINPIHLGSNPLHNYGEATICMGAHAPPTNQFSQYVAIWRPEKNIWAKVKIPHGKIVAYCNGRIFVFDYETRMTMVIDVDTGSIVSKIPPPDEFTTFDYLVEAHGELLGVAQLFECCVRNLSVDDCRFDVYRLEQARCWVKLNGVGDLMLFLGADNGIVVRASGIKGVRGNCIYFMWSNVRFEFVLARYDMAEGRAELVPRPTNCDAIHPKRHLLINAKHNIK